ncbi:MAG TPA: hypothetical protein VK446_07550 [Methylocystis sp.]|nr:hypothetical protein [Methylocystis sp.]
MQLASYLFAQWTSLAPREDHGPEKSFVRSFLVDRYVDHAGDKRLTVAIIRAKILVQETHRLLGGASVPIAFIRWGSCVTHFGLLLLGPPLGGPDLL